MFFDDPASMSCTHAGTHSLGLLQTDTLPSTFVLAGNSDGSGLRELGREMLEPADADCSRPADPRMGGHVLLGPKLEIPRVHVGAYGGHDGRGAVAVAGNDQ
jgi:hypothetical protein